MRPTITSEQRDALHGQIFDRLSGIGDVWLAVCARDYRAAERLGREYSDDLRLLLDDLGFGEGPSGSIGLTTPPDLLRRALPRLRDAAVSHSASLEGELAEAREAQERDRLVAEACRSVLAGLDGEG